MATDTRQIALNLAAFYNFGDKVVLDVGAGGGQLADFARAARQVIAIDRDPVALQRLTERLYELGLVDRFALVAQDFFDVTLSGDVVLFEFCLHDMVRTERALVHARQLAQDVVVIDHAPESPWSWCAMEDDRVYGAWKEVERYGIRRQRDVDASQHFGDFGELVTKLAVCGPSVLERIDRYRDEMNISIPMPYRLALL